MASFKELYEAEQQNSALEQIKDDVYKVNEELFKLLDKYLVAAWNAYAPIYINKEKTLSWKTSESSDLPYMEDYRKLFINTVDEYTRYYNTVIKKVPALMKEKALKEKSSIKFENDFSEAFKYISELEYSTDILSNIGSCKDLYNYEHDEINIPAMSVMSNEKMFAELQKIKNDLSSKSVEQVPENRIESKIDINTIPVGISFDKELENETDDENNTKNNTKNNTDIKKMVQANDEDIINLSNNISDENFIDLIGKIEEHNKQTNEEFGKYLKDHSEISEKFKELINQLGDYKDQILPAMWIKNKLLLTENVNTIIDLLYYNHILNLINEAEEFDDSALTEKTRSARRRENTWRAQQEQNDNQKTVQNTNKQEKQNDEQTGQGQEEQNQKQNAQDVNLEEIQKESISIINDNIKVLMNDKDVEKFKSDYVKWLEQIKILFKKIQDLKNEKINDRLANYNDKDPLYKAAACIKAIEELKNNKSTGERSTEPQQQNSSYIPDNDGDMLVEEFMMHNFLKRLNEHFH